MKNTNRHWYVVGHRAGARIFEQDGIRPALKLIYNFNNPRGHLRDNELVSDRQGRSDRTGAPGHTPVGSDYKPRKHVLETFAHEIGAFLEREAERDTFETLVLVAEPHVLGELKKVIGHVTSIRLRDPVSKDLVHVSDRDMAAHLKGCLCMHEAI